MSNFYLYEKRVSRGTDRVCMRRVEERRQTEMHVFEMEYPYGKYNNVPPRCPHPNPQNL